jgi:3-oxocholest-4-en-26-oate---CoA ligase
VFNLGRLNESLAAAFPEREAIVFRDRRITWGRFAERTRRLANFLLSRGLGCHRERSRLAGSESGQDHLGLYLYNGNEYLEGMVASYKARVAPFNVNYRYVDEELVYLLTDAEARALVYHASFAPILARIRSRLPKLELLVQVADESGHALLPGAIDYEDALASSSADPPAVTPSSDDLYILYTGGTTGMPKGVLWRQHDIFVAALGGKPPGGMPPIESVEDLVERARQNGIRALPAPPFMHGAAHWIAFNAFHGGGTVVLPDHPERLDAKDVWSTIVREKVVMMAIVGDAFARPLLDELRRNTYDISSFHILGSGGAILTPALKAEFLELVPHLMIIDAFGASETGGHGMNLATAAGTVTTGQFSMNDTVILKEDLSGVVATESRDSGLLARSGNVPLGYFKDPEKSRRTFPEIDGVRYSAPGDHACYGDEGRIVVLGRGSVCINSGGEKIYPEEVEQALKHHPKVYDAVVVGTAHPRWGQQVTALVELREGETVSVEELVEFSAGRLSRYKLPKQVFFVGKMVRSPSGKADYRWAKSEAERRLSEAS